MKVVAKQWFLLKQLLLRLLCSILKVKVEDESDSKTKVSETTLCETLMIYLESESDGKTLMISLGLTWELATSSSLSRATTIAFADSRISFFTCHPKNFNTRDSIQNISLLNHPNCCHLRARCVFVTQSSNKMVTHLPRRLR